MKAKKQLGQHFLRDAHTAQSIANLIDNYDNVRNVLEVGPGTGALTRPLSKKNVTLRAVELDSDASRYLLHHHILEENQLITQSFLKLNLSTVFDGEPFILIGNFPYNISSQILFHALENREYIPCIIGMFQKEVALRVVGDFGSKQYGVISVLIQQYYSGRVELELGPEEFDPPPKVDSAVISLEIKAEVPANEEFKRMRTIVKLAFGQRRKKMRNSLRQFLSESNAEWEVWDKRPEQLSPNDFLQLSQILT